VTKPIPTIKTILGPVWGPILGTAWDVMTKKTILGTQNIDTLSGNGFATTMMGLDGDDVLLGWGVKYDRVKQTAVEDTTKSWNETLLGGRGKDTLYGGAGDDALDGGEGNDVLIGGTGNDTFVLSAGNDVVKDFFGGTSVVLDFEGFPNFSAVPGGYGGLTWTNAWILNALTYSQQQSGYRTVLTSGSHVGYDGGGSGAGFANANADFDFSSANLAAAWNNNLIVTVNAYDDGVLVGTATLQMDPNVKSFVNFVNRSFNGPDSGVFTGRFTSIDAITIDGAGGTNAGLGGSGTHVAMEDIKIRYGDMDRIDVADGTNIASLIGTATSDGHGGTILTHSTGTLTLVGVAPGDVSADWFV